MTRNYLSGSIKKGLEIIECIGKSPKPLKASQVSSITKLDRATTFKILTYLTSTGYVFKDTKNNLYSLNISEAVRDADVIVIGTPLSVSEKMLPKLADLMTVNAILTDVGSVKGGIVRVARESLAEKFPNFVPGHPIAGTEKNGVEASYEDLFVDHRVILTPLKETSGTVSYTHLTLPTKA